MGKFFSTLRRKAVLLLTPKSDRWFPTVMQRFEDTRFRQDAPDKINCHCYYQVFPIDEDVMGKNGSPFVIGHRWNFLHQAITEAIEIAKLQYNPGKIIAVRTHTDLVDFYIGEMNEVNYYELENGFPLFTGSFSARRIPGEEVMQIMKDRILGIVSERDPAPLFTEDLIEEPS